MNATEYLLVCLMEECDEVSQRCAKALRFGLGEIQPGQEKNNAERLVDEMTDLVATIGMIEKQKIIEFEDIEEKEDAFDAKQAKIRKYAKYSQELGILEEEIA